MEKFADHIGENIGLRFRSDFYGHSWEMQESGGRGLSFLAHKQGIDRSVQLVSALKEIEFEQKDVAE